MTGIPYLKDGKSIYEQSFATIKREARLDRFPDDIRACVTRMIHACGMVEIADRIVFDPNIGKAVHRALTMNAPILCDCEMVKAGIITRYLPDGARPTTSLNDPRTPDLAKRLNTTRSAAQVELWKDQIEGAIIVIGNAPTALFHLLERLDQGWPKPAAIIACPVGFVGAAESKAALAENSRGIPFITLRGRKGGSAITAAAMNGLAAGLPELRQ